METKKIYTKEDLKEFYNDFSYRILGEERIKFKLIYSGAGLLFPSKEVYVVCNFREDEGGINGIEIYKLTEEIIIDFINGKDVFGLKNKNADTLVFGEHIDWVSANHNIAFKRIFGDKAEAERFLLKLYAPLAVECSENSCALINELNNLPKQNFMGMR